MKKLAILLVAGATLASCNREVSQEAPSNGERYTVRSGSEISGEIHPMNETITVSGKNMATNFSYTYQTFAEGPPNLDYTLETNTGLVTGTSNLAQATAVFPVDDFLFVTWHLEDEVYGGAVSCYRYNGGTQTYDYISVAEFDDTDFHELHVSKNSLTGFYEIFVVGQRSPGTSGYVLNGHRGAIVGKLHFNYINNQFDVSQYDELPLPGFGANDIISAGGQLYVVTGDGSGGATPNAGGIYKTNSSLDNVSEAFSVEDGVIIEADPFNSSPASAEYAVVWRTSHSDHHIYYNANSSNALSMVSNNESFYIGSNVSSNDLERNGACFVPASYDVNGNVTSTDILVALGKDKCVLFDGTNGSPTPVPGIMHTALSLAYDHSARIIYVAAADQGLHMLAANGYPGGALVNAYDPIATFVPPTSVPLAAPSFNVKDVSTYLSNNIAIAVGGADASGTNPQKGGVYFARRN